jgi:hypothetical protein
MKEAIEIASALSGGDRRSIGAAGQVVAHVLHNPASLAAVIEGIFHRDAVIAMRCADVAEKVSAMHPDWLQPFCGDLVKIACECKQQEVRWHIAQMLPRVHLSTLQKKTAIGLLFEYLGDESKIVKVFAVTALADFAAADASLRNRLVPVLKQFVRNGSPAMRNRARKLLAGLAR